MKIQRRLLLILTPLVVLVLGAGCAQKAKVETAPPNSSVKSSAIQTFEDGLVLLEKERYADAEKAFLAIVVQKPASEFDTMVFYNLGAAYEGQKKCEKATEYYRYVARSPIKKMTRLQAQALFRLSYVYECLGDNKKTLAALLDVYRRRDALPVEVGRAEVPARLAAAYARVGQMKQAQKYFAIAEKGIVQTQANYSESVKMNDLVARVLFFMGRMDYMTDFSKGIDGQIQSQRLLQTYLLRSIAMDQRQWSQRAFDQLTSSYDTIIKQVRADIAGNDADGVKNNKALQVAARRLRAGLENLDDLKKLRIPNISEPELLKRLFVKVEDFEKALNNELIKFPVQNELTFEGRKRQAIKREGQVISQPTDLEKKGAKKE